MTVRGLVSGNDFYCGQAVIARACARDPGYAFSIRIAKRAQGVIPRLRDNAPARGFTRKPKDIG